jgi:hypothetical protein
VLATAIALSQSSFYMLATAIALSQSSFYMLATAIAISQSVAMKNFSTTLIKTYVKQLYL